MVAMFLLSSAKSCDSGRGAVPFLLVNVTRHSSERCAPVCSLLPSTPPPPYQCCVVILFLRCCMNSWPFNPTLFQSSVPLYLPVVSLARSASAPRLSPSHRSDCTLSCPSSATPCRRWTRPTSSPRSPAPTRSAGLPGTVLRACTISYLPLQHAPPGRPEDVVAPLPAAVDQVLAAAQVVSRPAVAVPHHLPAARLHHDQDQALLRLPAARVQAPAAAQVHDAPAVVPDLTVALQLVLAKPTKYVDKKVEASVHPAPTQLVQYPPAAALAVPAALQAPLAGQVLSRPRPEPQVAFLGCCPRSSQHPCSSASRSGPYQSSACLSSLPATASPRSQVGTGSGTQYLY